MSEFSPRQHGGGESLVRQFEEAERLMLRIDIYNQVMRKIVFPVMDSSGTDGEVTFSTEDDDYVCDGQFAYQELDIFKPAIRNYQKLLVLTRDIGDEQGRSNILLVWEKNVSIPLYFNQTKREAQLLSLYPNGGYELYYHQMLVEDSEWEDVIRGETSIFIDYDTTKSSDVPFVDMPSNLIDFVRLKDPTRFNINPRNLTTRSLRDLTKAVNKLAGFRTIAYQ